MPEVAIVLSSIALLLSGLAVYLSRRRGSGEPAPASAPLSEGEFDELCEGLAFLKRKQESAEGGIREMEHQIEVLRNTVEALASRHDPSAVRSLAQRIAHLEAEEEDPSSLAADSHEDIVAEPEKAALLRPEAEKCKQLRTALSEVLERAPAGLRRRLKTRADTVVEVAERMEALMTYLETGRATDQGLLSWAERREEELTNLYQQVIPGILDTCDEVGAGYPDFEGATTEQKGILLKVCDLQEIRPQPGTQFNAQLHTLVNTERARDPALRNTIASCSTRGFKRSGELIRKPEVTVYK